MFIYFPEFLYNHTSNFIRDSFRSKISKDNATQILKEKMFSPDMSNKIREFEKFQISLPTVDFNHCFNYFEFNPERRIISNYSFTKNKIEICLNYVKTEADLRDIIDKEIYYSYAFHFKLPNKKKLELKDYAKLSVNACKHIKGFQSFSAGIHKELTKRCAYMEMKKKHREEIFLGDPESEKSELKFNETVRSLIENNYITF